MNELLTKLGIPVEIQTFFNVSAHLTFNYGDQQERYGDGFHTVPSTRNVWVAGDQSATHVVVSYSVIEAMAFVTLKRHHYTRLEQVAFVAVGNRLHIEQSNWIRKNFPGRKFIMVFGNDLTGHIADIKLTAGIKNIPLQVFYLENEVLICSGKLSRIFHQEQISLHAFQEAFAIRPRFSTEKPAQALTFLDQLKYAGEK